MANCIDSTNSEQLCYIPCNFCNIVLVLNKPKVLRNNLSILRVRVSVPCSNLFDIVTVRCGHCTNMWTVNMAAAFQSSSSSWQCHTHHLPQVANYTSPEHKIDFGSSSTCNSRMQAVRPSITSNPREERIVNRPPEKRQRVPSAYNQFIKEEIQRIKANNPDITHRVAFSTAAKNWAHFPHIHFGLTLETKNQAKLGASENAENHIMHRAALPKTKNFTF